MTITREVDLIRQAAAIARKPFAFHPHEALADELEAFARRKLAKDECEHCGDTGIEPAAMTFDAGDGEGEDQPCSVCSA